MARGTAKSDEERLAEYDQQITDLKAKQAKLQAKIDTIESKKKDINEKEKQKRLSSLLDQIESSGKTVEEVLNLIK